MTALAETQTPVQIDHVIKGETISTPGTVFGSGVHAFTTPPVDPNELVWSRTEQPPLADTPLEEIMDVLEAVGDRLTRDTAGYLAEALERNAVTNPLPRDLLERAYKSFVRVFNRDLMNYLVDTELGGRDAIDGWRETTSPSGRSVRLRAYPPRIVHVLAGNGPGTSAQTLVRGALVKGVHLLKMPSNDLFSTPAVLKTLAKTAPGHPITKSFSTAYWRGGDETIEPLLFRPQYFDKLVAWGGEAAIRNAVKHIGPGFELISFDPKTSISMIGREAFESDASIQAVADLAANDATILNQQACVSSRIQFVEASQEDADRFCEALAVRLGTERAFSSAAPWPVPQDIREEVDGLRMLEDFYRVWGDYEGAGLVIRSDEPVDFHPDGKVVNVVPVENLADAAQHVTVATQTVGVWPRERKAALRDILAARGTQRVVTLGSAPPELGLPHDGFYPMQRFVRWVNDED
ncbi:acyl-CoA reductase [Parvularcula marina]|uniref:Long-chain-fatty-acyl-CoA reductase n=1 Tax=Parvularcula marina TaxID=2292771 RepID=A0A371RL99_9PROT|nr:acyl-CoA reductase [Parvularcula marina]RFB06242.1 long-chain-fatty-acyl-CoA reductase [Parvularcula marina]